MAKLSSTKLALTETPNHPTGDHPSLPSLPDEIIAIILLSLPAKSLFKFRFVSKFWFSLISNPQFIQSHHKKNSGRHNKLVFGSGSGGRLPSFSNFSLNPKNDGHTYNLTFDYQTSHTIRIVGSCNGLICVALDLGSLVIWNPLTGKTNKLPVSGENIYYSQYGFGYDAVNDDYKIMQFGWHDYDPGLHMPPHKSSRAQSWRKGDWPGDNIFDFPGVFVDGAIHWKVWRNDDDDDPCNVGMIVQDITSEACCSGEYPVDARGDVVVGLGVSGGCLCASYDYRSYMDVWVRKEKQWWSKVMCFDYLLCMELPRNVTTTSKLVFVFEKGGILLNHGSKLVMCEASKCREIHSLGKYDVIETATYCETLLSPAFHHIMA